jgi:hypothetical protein
MPIKNETNRNESKNDVHEDSYAALHSNMSSVTWLIDNGVSNQMTGDKRLFKTYNTLDVPRKVFTASSFTSLIILGDGEVVLEEWNGSGYHLVGLKGCLHVQGMSRSLFSVPLVVAKGANMSRTKNECAFSINGQKFGVWSKVKPTPLKNARRILAMGQR